MNTRDYIASMKHYDGTNVLPKKEIERRILADKWYYKWKASYYTQLINHPQKSGGSPSYFFAFFWKTASKLLKKRMTFPLNMI